MTEANAKAIQEAYAQANAKADKVVLMMNDSTTTDKELRTAKSAAQAKVDQYNRLMEAEYYRKMAEKHGERTVYELLNMLYVEGIISITYTRNDSGEAIKEERKVKNRKINLLHVHEDIGAQYFHEADWVNFLGKFSKLVANAVYANLETGVTFNYPIEKDAEAFNLPADADPASERSMTRIGQAMIDKIVFLPTKNKKGEEVNALKYEKKRWACIRESFTRKGNSPGCVAIGGPQLMCELFTDALFNIIHGAENSAEVMGAK